MPMLELIQQHACSLWLKKLKLNWNLVYWAMSSWVARSPCIFCIFMFEFDMYIIAVSRSLWLLLLSLRVAEIYGLLLSVSKPFMINQQLRRIGYNEETWKNIHSMDAKHSPFCNFILLKEKILSAKLHGPDHPAIAVCQRHSTPRMSDNWSSWIIGYATDHSRSLILKLLHVFLKAQIEFFLYFFTESEN